MFFVDKLAISSDFYSLEAGFYPSFTDIVAAKNTLIQERHNQSESCISVKVSQRTQEGEIYIANDGSGFAFYSTNDLGRISGSKVGNKFGVMLKKKDLTTRLCSRRCPHTLSHE